MVCGVGGGTYVPLPNDPDNNSILTATPVFGGVEVRWTYPLLNPFSVAHTRLYRSTSNDPVTKTLLATPAGNVFFDRATALTTIEYFYWIEHVSINGTVGALIGPASSWAKPPLEQFLLDLTGKIDQGHLAITLREEIAHIGQLETDLATEAQARLEAEGRLTGYFEQLQLETDETRTLILDETTARQGAHSAFVNSLNLAYASIDSNAAAILQEQTARVSEDEALAQSITETRAQIGTDIAAALTSYETAVDAAAARASLHTTLTSNYENHVAAALLDYETASTATAARASLRTAIQTDYEGHVATVLQNYETASEAAAARAALQTTIQTQYEGHLATALTAYETAVDAAAARANLTTTLQTDYNGKIGTVATNLTTVSNKTDAIGALYTAKVSVDDGTGNVLIGGFGVYNDGSEVEAGFDVDRFWVGRTGPDKIKPFIVDTDGTVYINEAVIKSLTFDKLRDSTGAFVVENGKIKADYFDIGTLTGHTLQTSANPSEPRVIIDADNNSLQVFGANSIGGPMTALVDIGTVFNVSAPIARFGGENNIRTAIEAFSNSQSGAIQAITESGTALNASTYDGIAVNIVAQNAAGIAAHLSWIGAVSGAPEGGAPLVLARKWNNTVPTYNLLHPHNGMSLSGFVPLNNGDLYWHKGGGTWTKLNEQVPTQVGAVNTYATLGLVDASPAAAPTLNPGDTISGNSLRYANSNNVTGPTFPGGAGSVWRCMGHITAYNQSATFLRIS